MRMVIYHNEACSTSRRVLALLRAAGAEVEVVDYLAEGWTRGQVLGLFAAAGVTVREALRVSEAVTEVLGLTDPTLPDEALLAAMVAHPILVQRPIVCSARGVRLCRPLERVLELLPPGMLVAADGQILVDAAGRYVG
jgi:arsenate reductase